MWGWVREAPLRAMYPLATLASTSAKSCPTKSSSVCAEERAPGREAGEEGLVPLSLPFDV